MRHTLKNFSKFLRRDLEKDYYKPFYKLVDIVEKHDEYLAVIKIINKNTTFKAKPERILANDHVVDQFAPRDVRALSYLGYLGIHAPQYRILAKKFLEDEKMSFVLKEKGKKKPVVKNADQILQEKDMVKRMNSEDASTISYVSAVENMINEQKQKEALLKKNTPKKERTSDRDNEECDS